MYAVWYGCYFLFFFFFFNDTATTEIYTLSLHDALPIWLDAGGLPLGIKTDAPYETAACTLQAGDWLIVRSEEHTSELQSQFHLVCRLLLEKKKNTSTRTPSKKKTHSINQIT